MLTAPCAPARKKRGVVLLCILLSAVTVAAGAVLAVSTYSRLYCAYVFDAVILENYGASLLVAPLNGGEIGTVGTECTLKDAQGQALTAEAFAAGDVVTLRCREGVVLETYPCIYADVRTVQQTGQRDEAYAQNALSRLRDMGLLG